MHPLDRRPEAEAAANERFGLWCLREDWRPIWEAHTASASVDAWRELASKVEIPGCVQVRCPRSVQLTR